MAQVFGILPGVSSWPLASVQTMMLAIVGIHSLPLCLSLLSKY